MFRSWSIMLNWDKNVGATGSLLLAITVLLFFGITFARLYRHGDSILNLLQNVIKATLRPLAFLGMVLAFYILLNSNVKDFGKDVETLIQGGTAIDRQRLNWEKQWGDALTQKELVIEHFVERETVVEVLGKDGITLYRNETTTEKMLQESIREFNGVVDIQVVDREFNRYLVNAQFEYLITNWASENTLAKVGFPLDYGNLYENVQVMVDDVLLEGELEVTSNKLVWDIDMQPGQSSRIFISYLAHGMKSYSYDIPAQRGIENFNLEISTDTKSVYPFSVPKIDVIQADKECLPEGNLCTFMWSLDRLVMDPTMGVTFPNQKVVTHLSNEIVDILRYVPRALILLSSLVMLSVIILGETINLIKFMLQIGIFSAHFLGLMSISILGINYIWGLLGLAVPILGLQVLILRKAPYANLSLMLSALFGIAYPFAGLLPAGLERNSFDGIIMVLILIYLFGLVLYSRMRKKRIKESI